MQYIKVYSKHRRLLGTKTQKYHWNRGPRAVSRGQGRGGGGLGRLMENEALSSEAEELLLCSGEGLSSSKCLKLGPNTCVKMTGLQSARVVITRNRIAMAHFCPGWGHGTRSPKVWNLTLGPAGSPSPATRAETSAGGSRLAFSPMLGWPGGWFHSRDTCELDLKAE